MIGGIIGSIFGFFYFFIFYSLNLDIALIILKPVYYLLEIVLRTWMGFEGIGFVMVYIILSTFIYGIIGALIGFGIYWIKKRKDKQ